MDASDYIRNFDQLLSSCWFLCMLLLHPFFAFLLSKREPFPVKKSAMNSEHLLRHEVSCGLHDEIRSRSKYWKEIDGLKFRHQLTRYKQWSPSKSMEWQTVVTIISQFLIFFIMISIKFDIYNIIIFIISI